MGTLGVFLFTVLAVIGFFIVLWLAYVAIILPVKAKHGERVFFCLQISGSDPDLEETVRGLVWMRRCLYDNPLILIYDAGMENETLEKAQWLTEHFGGIKIVSAKELEQFEIWMNRTDSLK
jgi:hypothetical protein